MELERLPAFLLFRHQILARLRPPGRMDDRKKICTRDLVLGENPECSSKTPSTELFNFPQLELSFPPRFQVLVSSAQHVILLPRSTVAYRYKIFTVPEPPRSETQQPTHSLLKETARSVQNKESSIGRPRLLGSTYDYS